MMDISDLDAPQYVNFETLEDTSPYQGNDRLQNAESEQHESSITYRMDVNDDTPDSILNGSQESLDVMLNSSEAHSEYSLNNNESSQANSTAERFAVNHLRNSPFPVNKAKKGNKVSKVTKVKPFHFRTDAKATGEKKRKRENEYLPLAEQVAAFQRKTPERFHTTKEAFHPTEHWSPHIVQPKSPTLRATKRSRTVNALSREQEEEKEVEEMKKYKFRARPFNPNITQKQRGMKINRKHATKPKDFNLKTTQRAIEHQARKKEEEQPYEFHARPVPKAILQGPVGIKEKPVIPVTEAKTPKFSLKERSLKWQREQRNVELEEPPVIKAAPLPKSTAPFVVKHEKKMTEVQPFSFDLKDKKRMMLKEQRILEEIEKENEPFIFKAQLMPSPTPSALPAVPKKPPTQPKPFNLHFEANYSRSSFEVSEEHPQSFKAQPATVLKKPAFVPEKPSKELKEPKEFHLQTDIRATVRQQWKQEQEKKMQEQELENIKLQAEKEELEREEIKKLRQELVHKANPVRHYKPVIVVKNAIPVTQPISPKFKTDERLQLKHMNDYM